MNTPNILSEATNAIKERINSSFFGPFIPIWIIYNWKIILIFFDSSLNAFLKIDQILEIYNNQTFFEVLTPFFFTCAYIFLTPFITEAIMIINRIPERIAYKNAIRFSNEKQSLEKLAEVNTEKTIHNLVLINRKLVANYRSTLTSLKNLSEGRMSYQHNVHQIQEAIKVKSIELNSLEIDNALNEFENLYILSLKITQSYVADEVFENLRKINIMIRHHARKIKKNQKSKVTT